MRIPLGTDLKTRTGAPDKDARLKNAYVEVKNGESYVRKRLIAQGGVSIGTGTAQGGIGFSFGGTDYIYTVNGDVTATNTSSIGTTWASRTTYSVGAHVTVNFVDYWAIDSNIGNNPTSSPTHWSTSFIPAIPFNPTAWTLRTLNATGLWDNVIFGERFIAWATSFPDYQFSIDGITWQTATHPFGTVGCAFGAGIYVNAGGGTTYTTSIDGISWTNRSFPLTFLGSTVSYANNKFFVGTSSIATNTFITSTDGITWSAIISTIADIGSGKVVYGNGVYVSTDFNGFIKPFYYSNDGTNWTQATTAPNGSEIDQLAFGNGIFVALNASVPTQYATSIDGITWTTRTFPSGSPTGLAFGNGYFCAVQSSNSYISTDGINWTSIAFPLSSIVSIPVCAGNSKFVAVQYNSTSGATLK